MQYWESFKNLIRAGLYEPSEPDAKDDQKPRSALLLLLFVPLMCMAMFCASQVAFLLVVPGTIPQRIAALATANYSPWEYEQFQLISPRIETEVFLDQPPVGNPLVETQLASTAENQSVLEAVVTATAIEGLVIRPFTTVTLTETEVLTATPTATTLSALPSATFTDTPTVTATFTETLTPTITFTPSITPTNSITPPPTVTETLTPTPTITSTPITSAPVVSAPSANFTVVTSGLSVTVSNTSTGSITSYSWSYGDGIGTRTGSNPGSYTYTTGGTYTISLTVTGAGGTDTVSIPVSVSVPSTDLSFTLSSSNSTPQAGQTFTVTARMSNLTSTSASGVSANISFGSGLSYESFTGSGAFNGSTWTIGTLAANTSTTITMTVRADTAGTSPSVSGSLLSLTPADNNTSNNSSSVTINIQAVPVTTVDLAMGVTTSASNVILGDTFSYNLTATNNGTINATNAVISQTLPTGIAFVSSTDCTASGQTLTCTLGTLAAGASDTVTVQAQANQTGTLSSSASVSATQTDSNTANNSASASVTVSNEADLTLAMGVSSSTPPERGTVTYDVTLTNNGPTTATNIGIDVTLPTDVTFALASPGSGTYAATTGRWTVTSLASGASTVLNLTVTVNSGTAGTTLTASNATATLTETDPTPASSSIDITPTTATDIINLNTSLSGSTGNINAPSNLTYTATITNQGGDTATNVSALLTLTPSSLSVSSSSGTGTFDTATNTWTIGTLVPGQSVTRSFTFNVPTSTRGQTVTTEISLASFDQVDSDTTNNSASRSVNVSNPGLTMRKTVADNRPNIDETIVYTVQLRNEDARDYTGVVVTDNLPAGVTFVSYTADQGTYNDATGLWDVGTITAGTTFNLRITVTVDLDQAGNNIANTASITSLSPTDPNTSSNSDSVTIFVRGRLELEKNLSSGSSRPDEGAQITYRVELRNRDVADYTDVEVTDNLPTGVTYVSHIASQGTYDETTGIWDVGNLPRGARLTLDITVTVDNGTAGTRITNEANITQTVPTAPPDADLFGSQSIDPVAGILSLDKTLSSGSTEPEEGSQITYRVRLRNEDFGDFTGVIVTDNLPTGVTYVSHSASQGTYDETTGIWDVGNLPSGADLTLNITVTVNNGTAGTTITNTATITSTTPAAPPDADLSGSQSIDPVATGVDVTLDLSDAMSPSASAYEVGDVVTVRFILRNAGPETATNVVAVLDDIPDFTYLSTGSLPTGATYDSTTRTLTIPSISNGQTRSADINFIVDASAAGQTIRARAAITAVDQTNTSTDLTGGESYVINGTDLAVSKAINDSMPFEGQAITYTVTVSNTGQDTTAVEVTDQLPIGVSYISHTTATGTYDNATGIWTVGDMTTGTSAQLDIIVLVDVGTAGGTITNTADITNFTLYEIDLTNNSASVDINPQGGTVDLALSKVASTTSVVLGATFDYTITVTNNGTLPATNVEITDTLPSEVTFDSSVSCTHNTGVVTCTVGTLAVGGSQAVTVTVRASGVGNPVTNNASVALTETDADTSDNTASVNVTISPQDLNGVSLCSSDPATFQRWRIDNFNPFPVTFDWLIFGSGESGSATVPAASGGTRGELVFTTPTQSSNTLIVSVGGVQNDTVASGGATCDVDLGVSLAVDDATPSAQQTIRYTVTLTNNETTHTALDAVVDVFLPAGATIEGNTPSTGTWTAPQWTVDSLAPSASATLVLNIKLAGNDGDTLTTSANISSALQPDANTSNNTAFVDVTLAQLNEDLALAAFVFDPASISDETTTVMDITVQNFSTTTAVPNVIVPNLVPAELSYDSTETITAGTFDTVTNTWSVGTLAAGGTANLRLVVTDNTTNNSITATLTVNSPSNDDPSTANNTLSALLTITQRAEDLAMTAFVFDPASISDGTTTVMDITLENLSTTTAIPDIIVPNLVPAELSYDSTQTVTAGTFDSSSNLWSVGTLAAGGTANLRLVVRDNTMNNSVSTTLTASSSSNADPDTANNTLSATLTITPLLPDIVVNKTAPDPITDGNEFDFTISVNNTGTADASNVSLEDVLPSNMSFVSASATQVSTTCTENTGTVTCDIGTLTVGASETITIRVLPALSDPAVAETVTNTANVTLTETDATPADNSDSVTVTVQP